jgi:hypothetical protein
MGKKGISFQSFNRSRGFVKWSDHTYIKGSSSGNKALNILASGCQ